MIMREIAIENLITEIKRAIDRVENKIEEENYSDTLLRYIIFIENRSRRVLNRNLHPTDDEYRASRLLELMGLIEYVLQTFPGYYTETEIGLKYTTNKSNSFRRKTRDEDNGWFKVGLKFADGTIVYQTFGRPSFDDITINAGLPISLRPYVSDTYNNTGSKNIFSNEKKMIKIFQYCTQNNIVISEWFLGEYKKFE